MYEISHRQARYLLTKALDFRTPGNKNFPQEQWIALQQHLERCQECREYHQKMVILERNLRNSLHPRWSAVGGPAGGLASRIQTSRMKRGQKNGVLLGSGVVVLLIFCLVILSGRRTPIPVTGESLDNAVRLPTPTPLVDPANLFHGRILFTSQDTGNQEIFLFESGDTPETAELVNLTNSPANDTDPVWSPDGGWIAFLSDRTGKNEVFVVSVAGTGLTQLTDNPEIEWQGPLAWSPGGVWIAFIGQPQNRAGTSYVYIKTVFAKYPMMVETSAEASGPLSFVDDPKGPSFLVYHSRQAASAFSRYDFHSNASHSLTAEDESQNGFEPGNDSAFAYIPLPDSDAFLYIARKKEEGTEGSVQIRQITTRKDRQTKTYENLDSGPAGSMRELSIIPVEMDVATLVDPQKNGCWQLKILNIFGDRPNNPTIVGVCIDGGLENRQWTADGRWVVFQGHLPGEKKTALYGLHIPPAGEPEGLMFYQRLVDRINITGPLLVQP